jgi:pescadillo protein
MGKKIKKDEKGQVSNYISRASAVRKLQINLSDFRRLCILKGIYPREPKNKKKVGKGSTQNKTWYYRKDIAFLMHEPLLQSLRLLKIHDKKLKKAQGKSQKAVVKSLMERTPEFNIDHLIKERYPSFSDALKDLDDALSMIFLFATLPANDKVSSDIVSNCQRLALEFQNYIIMTHGLRKVFLSIKGIYYQVQVKGEKITWIVPYTYAQEVPADVDFRVMGTFLEFYSTLLGFVNYKLYFDIGLEYPPKLNKNLLEQGAELDAFQFEKIKEDNFIQDYEQEQYSKVARSEVLKVENIQDKIAQIQSLEEESPSDDAEAEELKEKDGMEGNETRDSNEGREFSSLFSGFKFYLNREVPRYALEFVIRSFGGRVGWDDTVGSASPFKFDDSEITHHIIDRPEISSDLKVFDKREFLQPQWIFDCINAGKILNTQSYHVGETLPHHLSPFVVSREGDYNPAEESEESDNEAMEDVVTEEQEKDLTHQEELEAEAAGVSFNDYSTTAKKSSRKVKSAKEMEEKETKDLAKIMMSKKDKHLYNQIQYSKKKKAAAVEKLKSKKASLKGR